MVSAALLPAVEMVCAFAERLVLSIGFACLLAAVVDDLALRPVKLVMKVASDGRASVSFLVAGSPF